MPASLQVFRITAISVFVGFPALLAIFSGANIAAVVGTPTLFGFCAALLLVLTLVVAFFFDDIGERNHFILVRFHSSIQKTVGGFPFQEREQEKHSTSSLTNNRRVILAVDCGIQRLCTSRVNDYFGRSHLNVPLTIHSLLEQAFVHFH